MTPLIVAVRAPRYSGKSHLFHPAAVLKCRAQMAKARRKNGRRNVLFTHTPFVQFRVQQTRMARLKAYYQLPRSERKSRGSWMKLTPVPPTPTYD